MRLARQDYEPHRVAERVRKRDDLAGQTTPGATDSLAPGSPGAPAAFWCAWTTVPSMKLFHLPNLSGRSRQGAPTRIRQSTVSMKSLLSLPVPPGSVFLPGRICSIRFHMKSVSTVLSRFMACMSFCSGAVLALFGRLTAKPPGAHPPLSTGHSATVAFVIWDGILVR